MISWLILEFLITILIVSLYYTMVGCSLCCGCNQIIIKTMNKMEKKNKLCSIQSSNDGIDFPWSTWRGFSSLFLLLENSSKIGLQKNYRKNHTKHRK